MEPIVLFGIQFTLSLVAYALIAFWYVVPRLFKLPLEAALVRLHRSGFSSLLECWTQSMQLFNRCAIVCSTMRLV